MKKTLRLIALTLCVITVALCFCGCNALDEMRNSLVTINESGNLVYGGEEFILLPECEELTPYFDYMGENYLYVVEEDVPLLLSSILGTEYIMSNDGKFITASDDYESTLYFCRSDIHKDILERINNGFRADSYCYSYYDYETDDTLYYTLKDAEREAVHTVLKNVKPNTLPDIANISYDYFVELYACSSDLLFQKYVYDLYSLDGKYYLTANSGDQSILYEVPSELNADFDSIIKAAKEYEYEYFDY